MMWFFISHSLHDAFHFAAIVILIIHLLLVPLQVVDLVGRIYQNAEPLLGSVLGSTEGHQSSRRDLVKMK